MKIALITSLLILSFYTLVQILSDGNRTDSRKYLIGVIVTLGISQLPSLISDLFPGRRWVLFELLPTRHWVFLIGPAVFFYARACMGRKGRGRDVLHFLPFFLWWFVFILVMAKPAPPRFIPRIYGLTNMVSLLSYGVLILVTLTRFTRGLREEFSYTDLFLEMKWLSYIAAVLVIVTLSVSLGVTLFYRSAPREDLPVHDFLGDPEYIDVLHSLAVLIFLFVFSLMGQKQERHRSRPKEEIIPELSREEPPKASSSVEFEELLSYMDRSKIYLENNLSLQRLSEETRIARHDLSRLINRETGENFFHFINRFRAREFQRALRENRYPNFTLLGIAHECGFNSKATFNAAIKREFGVTPSQIPL
ncbi:MAG: AraC family transcriptional regulator [Spirochaetales bacterium]|nr:AraC family transcriptional regulator [Spirochaetales bacterium]